MTNVNYFKDQFNKLQESEQQGLLSEIREENFRAFNHSGLPTLRMEEWKYTNISSLFDRNYEFSEIGSFSPEILSSLDKMRITGHQEANELVFLNGQYCPSLSVIRSPESQLVVLSLEEALKSSYKDRVKTQLGQSNQYIKDGIHALNASFIHEGLFIYVPKGQQPVQPIYIYHLTDARQQNILSQPRSLVYLEPQAKLQIAESYQTMGVSEAFSNEVMEIVVRADAFLEYYKIQNDGPNSHQVNTTHISQLEKSHVHTAVLSFSGGMIRNNLNLVLDAGGNESHLYGLSLLKDNTHVDNHTMIDNKEPDCFSNQLYKAVADHASTSIFSGRIVVRPDAQKTNAYQSSKNILLSDLASINAKPQLEIFADDVKCSHGCTVGQLDEETLYYLRARGIPKEQAEILLLQAFAADILGQIKPAPLQQYVEKMIYDHLSFSS